MTPDQSQEGLPPPPSTKEINLAYADIVVHAVLLPIVLYITWKHGKKGMVCWPILFSFFVLQFVNRGYQLAHKDQSDIPNAVSIFTHAGGIACLLLTLIGIIYEVNLTIPSRGKRWGSMLMLGITHLVTTAGITMATYGGSPNSDKPDGVAASTLDKAGNCMMVAVLVVTCGWWALTLRRVLLVRVQVVWPLARMMLLAVGVGIPFLAVILAHNTTYAFDRMASLDPVMGTFATTLVLGFGAQLAVTISFMIGGWLSRNVHTKN